MPLDKKYKSIMETGILLGSAILLAVFIALSLANYLGNSSMPNVAVSTTSMMPIYRGFQDGNEGSGALYPFRGDILLVRKVPANSLEVGDVIVFNATGINGPGDPVVHRIIAIWEDNGTYFFATAGDNNPRVDGWKASLSEERIIGKVVLRIPHVGWFLLALQTNLGKILILTLAVLVLFGEEILRYLGLSKDDNEKVENSDEKNTQDIGKTRIKTQSKSLRGVLKKKETVYISIGLGILILFIASNLLASVTHSPSIDCYTSGQRSLLDSSTDSMQTLTSRAQIENTTSYFYYIMIELKSGGIFNNIDYFEIRVNQSKGLYRWTIVNNYIGIHTIRGGIISQITGIVEISIVLYTRGLFASAPIIHTFPIILQG